MIPVPIEAFLAFAIPAIGFSLVVLFTKKPVTSAFALVIAFFCFAAILALLEAHLLAAMQVLVYAGAIMVLFVFVIMLLNADLPTLDLGRSKLWVKLLAGLMVTCFLAIFIWAFKNAEFSMFGKGSLGVAEVAAQGGNSRVISRLMFSEWLLPFELTSVLLLGGMIGTVAVAMRKKKTPSRGRRS